MTTKIWKPIETKEQYEEYTRELHEMEATFKMTEKMVASSYSPDDPRDYDAVIEQCFTCSEAYTKWLAAKAKELGHEELLRTCREWHKKSAGMSPYASLVRSTFDAAKAPEATTPPAAG